MNKNIKTLLNETLISPGYCTNFKLSIKELELFRSAITEQYLETINESYPKLVDEFKRIGIENYHLISNKIDHDSLWNKSKRCLKQSFVNNFKKMDIYQRLTDVYGQFKICDIVYDNNYEKGKEEIYWRIVRPKVTTDIGPLHADRWFHEILDMNSKVLGEKSLTIKIWIPIYSEIMKNGLLIVPNSNLKTWKYTSKLLNNVPKPVFLDKVEPILVPTDPGNMIIFSENTLHGGAFNNGNTTRISCEITMIFEKDHFNDLII